jgi:hypothetical protein
MLLRHQPRSGEPLCAQPGHERCLARCARPHDDNVQCTVCSFVQGTSNIKYQISKDTTRVEIWDLTFEI